MKPVRSPTLALGACLLATIAFTVETHAQAKENFNFEAGIAAYQADNLPLGEAAGQPPIAELQ
jgi:hypothetical protein